MTFDTLANIATSTIGSAPVPALSGPTLSLKAGDGAKWAAAGLVAPFNCPVWPPGTAVPPMGATEIVRVTAMVGDVLTVGRATSTEPVPLGPIAIGVGYNIGAFLTAKMLLDIIAAIGGGGGVTIPLVLDDPTATNPVLEIGVTGAAHQSVMWDADGSAHFSDGTNPPAVQFGLDAVIWNDDSLGVFPDGSGARSIVNFYGSDVRPDGSGTTSGGSASGEARIDIQAGRADLWMYGEWTNGSDGGATANVRAQQAQAWFQCADRLDTGNATLQVVEDPHAHPSLTLSGAALLDPTSVAIQSHLNAHGDWQLNYDGSMHWGDGTNPAKVRLVLDTVNWNNEAVALYPDNGSSECDFLMYGGDILPDGSGTAGGTIRSRVTATLAELHVAGDWIIGAPHIDLNADANTDNPFVWIRDASLNSLTMSITAGVPIIGWQSDTFLQRQAAGVLQIPQHGGGLTLTSPDGSQTKQIQLSNAGILVVV